MTSPV